MRTKTGTGRLRARFAVLLALMLAVAVFAPAIAGALSVNQASLRPNGFAGQDTYGGKPTRLTWQASLKAGRSEHTGTDAQASRGHRPVEGEDPGHHAQGA